MTRQSFQFPGGSTDLYFAGGFSHLKDITDRRNTVLITDEQVFALHQKRFRNWKVIVLKAGEEYKVQATADSIIEQLIDMEADRKTTLVGVGGGVVTDITGYVASVYMRGIRFGFVPTTLLALVDASIGGKNGIDLGVYKNIVGTIRQPAFILHDLVFLNTLPVAEWQNGFAEIIKHACIKDPAMFRELQEHSVEYYRKKKIPLCKLIQKNARIKIRIVQADEREQGDRKLLNFGHTLGHALENQYELSHGQAIAVGMTYACRFSEELLGFRRSEDVIGLLDQYGLPAYLSFDHKKVMKVLKMDKKREQNLISYILLERIGKGVIRQIPVDQVSAMLSLI